jgi:hypothetical protein
MRPCLRAGFGKNPLEADWTEDRPAAAGRHVGRIWWGSPIAVGSELAQENVKVTI